MRKIKCFMINPTNRYNIMYRRYKSGSKCTNRQGIHNYSELIETITASECPVSTSIPVNPTRKNQCSCGYKFIQADMCQKFVSQIWVDAQGNEYELTGDSELPVGAMYYGNWMNGIFPGPDGNSLFVMTPGGVWNIDAPASNCGKPKDRVHRCWCRHGLPPVVTVDKRGNTCNAGAGSIGKPGYHGFLQGGYLTRCP